MSHFEQEKRFILELMIKMLKNVDSLCADFFTSFMDEENKNLKLVLQTIIKKGKTLEIIKAFSLYNILLNIIGERFNIPEQDPLEKIKQTYDELLKEGFKHQEIERAIQSMQFYPVFTAHPTESRRRTFLEAHFAINEDLHKIFDLNETNRIADINYRLHLLWQTSLVRSEKLEVVFELDNLLYIVESSILQSAQLAIQRLSALTKKPFEQSPIVLGSWVGGDRDGNPFVSNELMTQVMKIQHNLIINTYVKKIDKLIRELSINQDSCVISESFKQSIQKEKRHIKNSKFNKEPFRAKLTLMKQKLQNRLIGINTNWNNDFFYANAKELLDDIDLLISNLSPICATNLVELRNLVLLGDFYLLKLDFREHKNIFENAISEIFCYLGFCDNDFSNLQEDKKLHILNKALSYPAINLFEISSKISPQSQNIIEIFFSIQWGQKNIAKDILGSFILSMTTNASDLLIVLWFAKLTGLWKPNVESNLFITPLFETIQDLQNAKEIITTLSQNKHYKLYLKDCKQVQKIMIGYSDSSKDGGIFASNYNLFVAICDLMELGELLNIKFLLFHGKGGSVSRGGGGLDTALLASPPKSVLGLLKVTEQGEMIGSKYLSPISAQFNIANTLGALLKKTCYDMFCADKKYSTHHYFEEMQEISKVSFATYRKLVYETKGFVNYFFSATPIDFIQQLNLGSRPSKRNSHSTKIEDLRAIPWVFAWTQNRSIIPAWYGLGSGLEAIKDKKLLRQCYLESDFFRATIDNISQAFLKVDLDIAGLYNDFVLDKTLKQTIWKCIKEEYNKTMDLILLIRDEKELLDSQEDIKETISMRKSSIAALNFIQIELIKNYHQSKTKKQQEQLMEKIHSTIVGIAQGMRNTG